MPSAAAPSALSQPPLTVCISLCPLQPPPSPALSLCSLRLSLPSVAAPSALSQPPLTVCISLCPLQPSPSALSDSLPSAAAPSALSLCFMILWLSLTLWFFDKFFPENSFLIGISSIFWREEWKYGERGFRYCSHVGHAIGAIAIAAATLGWDVKLLDGFGYKDLEKLMGLEIFPEFTRESRRGRGWTVEAPTRERVDGGADEGEKRKRQSR